MPETRNQALARAFADEMRAEELRRWCSGNGVRRSRGDTKTETAMKAVEQNPEAVIRELLDRSPGAVSSRLLAR